MSKKKNLHVITHPLLTHKLTNMRKKETNCAEFRMLMAEMSGLMAYEVTRDLKLSTIQIETPMEKAKGQIIGEEVILIPVLRAGNGMLDAMLKMLPFARVGHIGIYRDKFIHSTVEYFFRLPKDVKGKKILVLDPLLGTGDTAIAAINRLKDYSVGKIRFVCILASPIGIKNLQKAHPDIEIYTSCVDRELNAKGYILPGLGDAGDRIYATL